MDEEILTLPSDVEATYFKNTLSRYKTELSHPLELDPASKYKVGLCELMLPLEALPDTIEDCFIYCSLCDNSYVGNSWSKILRMVRVNKDKDVYEFQRVYYKTVEERHVTSIELFLATKKGEPYKFKSSSLPTSIVLSIIRQQ